MCIRDRYYKVHTELWPVLQNVRVICTDRIPIFYIVGAMGAQRKDFQVSMPAFPLSMIGYKSRFVLCRPALPTLVVAELTAMSMTTVATTATKAVTRATTAPTQTTAAAITRVTTIIKQMTREQAIAITRMATIAKETIREQAIAIQRGTILTVTWFNRKGFH